MKGSISPQPTLLPGERVPELLLPPVNGVPATFYERYCGRPAVILIASTLKQLQPFQTLDSKAGLLGILSRSTEDLTSQPIPILFDDGRLTQLLWDPPPHNSNVAALILDSTMRLVSSFDAADPKTVAAALTRIPALMPTGSVITATAPVLMLPQVLDQSLCQHLIAAHDASNFASGMNRIIEGKPTLIPDPQVKIRQDHRLEDPQLMQQLTEAVSRRILPGIGGAFNYPVTRFEAFKVVSYDAGTGGYFRRHRDNITPDARHRRFALSINLNDDYEGGYLVFPEFGPMRYRPEAGGAIVFSGSLLHEATDVTAGRRYVVISFLWGDEVRQVAR